MLTVSYVRLPGREAESAVTEAHDNGCIHPTLIPNAQGLGRSHDLATSSTVARWELAHRIKVRRHELGISVDRIAKHLGFTRNFFSAVENERSMLATDKLEVLLVMLEFGDDERAELTALDEAARNRGWWESKEIVDQFGDEGSRLFGLEQGATRIRSFDAHIVSGLLQTPAYTRATFSNDPRHSPVAIKRLVETRQRRQSDIRHRGTPVTAVLGEAALRQRWTDDDEQNQQLEHLLALIETDQHDIRVLTFLSAPGVLVAASTLEFLEFGSSHLPTVAYQEAVRELGFLEDGSEQFEQLRLAWDDGLNRALDQNASIDFIKDALADA